MGKTNLGPICKAIAGSFDDSEQIRKLRIQDYAFNGSLPRVSSDERLEHASAQGTLIPSMTKC